MKILDQLISIKMPNVAKPHSITHDYLIDVLEYAPDTGNFLWRKSLSPRGKVGAIAGGISGGRWCIRLDGRLLQASILAWFYMTKEWPSREIDHANRNKLDNRWNNLRLATRSQNIANKSMQKNNTSGYPGVIWHKASNKWMVQLWVDNEKLYLGLFIDKDEAISVYTEEKTEAFWGIF